jgi:platelet-activating factor acetylhydrolase
MASARREPSPAAKPSYLSRFSPVPAFPEYTGPYKVGTMDVEIPVSDLQSPCPTPSTAADISTVQYRIFYPATAESEQRPITWLPNPQRPHVSGYTRFMGIGPKMAQVLSFLPRHLHYTTIPVHKNAQLETPQTSSERWPTMIFSHGLGGSRNSYSYIAGSLASHGVVVICPEHRDGSAVVSFIRTGAESGSIFSSRGKARREVQYQRISHEVSPEVYETREAQLRIRLWELGLIHDAILATDKGTSFTNLNNSTPSLQQFVNRLNVHEPGSIVFGGHSFGAATVHQFLKSVYYADRPEIKAWQNPLFTPAEGSEIRKQITAKTPVMLLDMWCLALLAPNSAPLYNLPLPVYSNSGDAPGGNGILAIESESFYKWNEHLHAKARILSPDPTAKVVTPELYETESGYRHSEPNFFYVVKSAHLNQSDFGILFPWLTKKVFDAQQPERALRLNLRAQLQFLRANNVPVARTYAGDLVDGAHTEKLDAIKDGESNDSLSDGISDGISDDKAIFERSADAVDHWKWIDLFGLGDAGEKEKGKTTTEQVEEGEKEMKGQLEPAEQTPPPAAAAAPVAVGAAA